MDLAVVEGAGGDQVVEVAGRLPQLAVALADRGGGDPGQLLGQGRPGIAGTRAVADGRELDRTAWSLGAGGAAAAPAAPVGTSARWGAQITAGDPLVGWPEAWRLGGATT